MIRNDLARSIHDSGKKQRKQKKKKRINENIKNGIPPIQPICPSRQKLQPIRFYDN